jgi:hypothetical protein
MYNTTLKPVVTHDRETGSMAVKHVMLNAWDGKVLRKAYGPISEQVIWRIRTNQELRKVPGSRYENYKAGITGISYQNELTKGYYEHSWK